MFIEITILLVGQMNMIKILALQDRLQCASRLMFDLKFACIIYLRPGTTTWPMKNTARQARGQTKGNELPKIFRIIF